jgi:amino acid transporter
VDAVAPVAEESKTPRRLIPLATILVLLIAGLYWTLVSYGFAISVPVSTVEHYVSSGQITPVLPITRSYIGGWAVLVPITGFTAALASFGASLYAASRITYALSREGFLNSYFKTLHPRFQTPWRAEAATLVVALVFLIAVSFWQGGPANAYGYLGEIFVFFVLILYMFVNLANLVYHARYQRSSFNWFLNGFIPVAGIAIDGYILYKGFFVSEISLPFKSGSSIVWFSVGWAVLGIVWTIWWTRRKHLASISLAVEV